jgi:hypothetical protein
MTKSLEAIQIETLTDFLAIQTSQTEIFSRKMMEFSAECDRLRASNKELCEVLKFFVDWAPSRVPPNPWEAERMLTRGRALLETTVL